MAEVQSGPAGRIERVRALMAERGYDAVLVRDEANLRWLTGVPGTFDFSHEYPHAGFITASACFFHTDSRYFNAFATNLPADNPWQLDQEVTAIPDWVAERALACRVRAIGIEDDTQIQFYRGLERGLEDRSIWAALPLMHADLRDLRAVKDEEELALMRRAQTITDAAFQHMLTFIQPGQTEKEIKNELESWMFAHGAESLAFSTIVASGPNTANPHAVPSDRVVERGDFVLMDYGAGYHDYRSDMTRTVVLGEPSPEQLDLYELVRATHEACAAAVHAGVDGKDIHELSVRLISEAGFGDYYKHGLGHGVGIDIHENPNFGRRSNIVPAGSVITVEPGVYLPGVGGVRLEDCGLVTADGYEPFTQSPHELQVIDC